MAKSIDNAGEDHGSNLLTGDQLRAFVRLMSEADQKCKAANEERKKLRKELKAAGVQLGDFDAMMRMMDWTREEVGETFDRRLQYAQWLNLPIGTQGRLAYEEDTTGEETAADVAFSKGYQAGIKGLSQEVPEEHRDNDQNWLKGYQAGQDSIAMDMIAKKKDTDAT